MADLKGVRIAMIIQSYLPRLGGAEKQLAAVCRELREKGLEPSIITRRYTGMQSFEVIEGTPVYRMPAPRPKPLAALCYILFGLRQIRKIKPQVLHVHELLSPSDMAILAKKAWNIPLMVKVLRGGKLGDLDKLNHRFTGKARIRRLKKYVDVFLSISREISAELAREGIEPSRCRFIPNGVDVEVYQPAVEKDKARLRRELGLPDGFVCVYSGRLATEKGLTVLLEAWREVVKTESRANLLVLGSGEMESELRASAGDNVIFGGYVPEPKPYYQTGDAFILPSDTEGLSNSMLEAMACGLPVVATAVGAAVDVITQKKTGLLVGSGSAPEMIEALKFLIENPRERARIGKNGMEKVRQDYSLAHTVNELVKIYAELEGDSVC